MTNGGIYRQLVAAQEVQHELELENDVIVDDTSEQPMSLSSRSKGGSSWRLLMLTLIFVIAARHARESRRESAVDRRRRSLVSTCSMTSDEC